MPYLAITASALTGGLRSGVLSIDRGNVFSVRTKNYGIGGQTGTAFVRDALMRYQMHEADGEVVLVTMPRMLGFAFNPVSFWLSLDKAAQLRAVVAEVNNTFGERHFYVCKHGDHRPIEPQDTVEAEKVFHVSPFMPVDGHYRFAFSWSEGSFGARIDLHDARRPDPDDVDGRQREPATSWRLVRGLLANPLLMFKVLGLIHYQAVRLWAKGVRHFRKPPPPAEQITANWDSLRGFESSRLGSFLWVFQDQLRFVGAERLFGRDGVLQLLPSRRGRTDGGTCGCGGHCARRIFLGLYAAGPKAEKPVETIREDDGSAIVVPFRRRAR